MQEFIDRDGRLRLANAELAKLTGSSAAFCQMLENITSQLASLKMRFAPELLHPTIAAVEEYLRLPVTEVNLLDFRRLTNSTYRLWSISNRDMTLLPAAEMLSQRFGLIANAVRQPIPELDDLFNLSFTMTFKTTPHWHETMALLGAQMIQPYFNYLDRVYTIAQRPAAPPRSGRKRRIGYLTWSPEITGSYAIGRVIYSIARGHALLDQGDEIFIYDRTGCSLATQQAFAEIPAVTMRHMSKTQAPCDIAQIIAADQLDVLIMEGFSAASFRVMQMRLASLQLYMPLGMHPMTASFFDGYVLYENIAREALALGVPTDRSTIVPWTLDERFLNPPLGGKDIGSAQPLLPAGKTIFAAFCRMEKITSPFLVAMAELLRRIPDAGLLLAGPNDKSRVAAYFASQGLSDRVSLPGPVDPHAFHSLIDVFVDTFPMCGGLAPVEAMAKGVPCLFLDGPGTESSRTLRDAAITASDADKYVALAVRLATDPLFMADRRKTALDIAAKTMNVAETTRNILNNINILADNSQH